MGKGGKAAGWSGEKSGVKVRGINLSSHKTMQDQTPARNFNSDADAKSIRCPECRMVILKCSELSEVLVKAAREKHRCATRGKADFEEEIR